MILSDTDIKNYIKLGKLKIESPRNHLFNIDGLSIQQNGLDCRIGNTIAIDKTVTTMYQDEKQKRHGDPFDECVIDTHNQDSINSRFKTEMFDSIVIQPRTNILLVTEEEFEFPDDLMAFCGLRSSVARNGFIAPITIVDAGFKGTLTIELFYGGNNPIKIYAGDRFLHMIFAKTNSPVQFPYNGFYNGQKTVNLPKTLDD